MRLLVTEEGRFLEHQSRRVRLDERDLRHLAKMTPMGRKVYFRKKGKDIRLLGKGDSEAEALLAWSLLPVREWDFPCLPW